MERSRPADDVLVCADVLGAFGVTPADVRARDGATDDLEAALAEALRDSRDRTAFLRQVICRADRGLDVSARYATRSLERELSAAFSAIGWSLSVTDRGDRLRLEATDPTERRRETTATYPETPLGTDNLPAILHAVNETLLEGVDARFVLCSSGRDRWRAALVAVDDLERVRARYGERLSAFDRPLLPEHDVSAYVPDGKPVEPWPEWALDARGGSAERVEGGTSALIEEAEPDRAPGVERRGVSGREPVASEGGYELGGGSPTVTRVRDRGGRPSRASAEEESTDRTGGRPTRETDDGFGTLSGRATTTRVSNDTFGAGVEPKDEDDRYLALGAALETGKDVSVSGLLEDEAFLPELPAVEPEETRIAFDDALEPDAARSRATAEQDGFVWVGADELETVRLED